MTMGSVFGHIDIPAGVSLGGFAQKRVWDGQQRFPLEINVVYLRSDESTGSDLALVSIDVTFANELSRRLRGAFSGELMNIVVAASHTHYSPSLMPEFPTLGIVDDGFCSQTFVLCQALILKARALSEKSDKPSAVSECHSDCWEASKRRRYGFSISRKYPFLKYGVVMQPNSLLGRKVPIHSFMLRNVDSTVIVWSFACHPTGFYAHNSISAEYVGLVRKKLRSKFGTSTTVIFLQGASGDLREPHISSNPKRVGFLNSVLGLLSARIYSYVQPRQVEWDLWANGLASRVVACAVAAEQGNWEDCRMESQTQIQSVEKRVGPGHPVTYLEMTALNICNMLQLLFVNAEVTSELAQKLIDLGRQQNRNVPDLIVATNIGECLGYLATDSEFNEGGYEAIRWTSAFGCASRVLNGTESLTVGLYKAILNTSYGKNLLSKSS